mmetsp:Transcript_34645/g.41837  ORF Transcript_34645/g.41837 Transcript_34645/m.41837 type:complete len:235 (-) Transcript_34645:940-1644(-)
MVVFAASNLLFSWATSFSSPSAFLSESTLRRSFNVIKRSASFCHLWFSFFSRSIWVTSVLLSWERADTEPARRSKSSADLTPCARAVTSSWLSLVMVLSFSCTSTCICPIFLSTAASLPVTFASSALAAFASISSAFRSAFLAARSLSFLSVPCAVRFISSFSASLLLILSYAEFSSPSKPLSIPLSPSSSTSAALRSVSRASASPMAAFLAALAASTASILVETVEVSSSCKF